MEIDKHTIEKIAGLARIDIEVSEQPQLIAEMNKILTFMQQLETLDTTDVAPLVYMNGVPNVWREDIVEDKMTPEIALTNSPVCRDNFFAVPKVIEK